MSAGTTIEVPRLGRVSPRADERRSTYTDPILLGVSALLCDLLFCAYLYLAENRHLQIGQRHASSCPHLAGQ